MVAMGHRSSGGCGRRSLAALGGPDRPSPRGRYALSERQASTVAEVGQGVVGAVLRTHWAARELDNRPAVCCHRPRPYGPDVADRGPEVRSSVRRGVTRDTVHRELQSGATALPLLHHLRFYLMEGGEVVRCAQPWAHRRRFQVALTARCYAGGPFLQLRPCTLGEVLVLDTAIQKDDRSRHVYVRAVVVRRERACGARRIGNGRSAGRVR